LVDITEEDDHNSFQPLIPIGTTVLCHGTSSSAWLASMNGFGPVWDPDQETCQSTCRSVVWFEPGGQRHVLIGAFMLIDIQLECYATLPLSIFFTDCNQKTLFGTDGP
jgi:hypothetical protein